MKGEKVSLIRNLAERACAGQVSFKGQASEDSVPLKEEEENASTCGDEV